MGESGTLARLASGLIGLGSGRGECTLVPAGSLRGRRSAALFRTLEAAGVGLVFGDSDPAAGFGTWPVRLRPMGPPATLRLVAPASSQEVSALLFGTAAHAGETLVEVEGLIPSEPYVELSRAALAAFGASVERVTADGRTNYTVRGPLQAPEQPLTVEVDASLAGVVLAAACLTEQRVRVRGVGGASAQGDVRMVEHLRAFGCVAGASVDGPLQSLVACGPASRAADLDLTGEPDLAPPLAIVAADAARRLGATSRLRGLGTLPGKESDRIEVLRTGLERAGFAVDATRDALTIAPGAAPPAGAAALLLDPACDHRMAFAFGLLGLIDARVYVTEPGCVAKSWPGFWTALQPLGVVAVPAPRG